YRMAELRQVNPDLMRPAGFELRLHQISRPPPLQHPEMRDRPASSLHHGHPLAITGMPPDRRVDRFLLTREVAPGGSQIPAYDTPATEILGQPPVGQVVLGDDEQAGGIAVQAV